MKKQKVMKRKLVAEAVRPDTQQAGTARANVEDTPGAKNFYDDSAKMQPKPLIAEDHALVRTLKKCVTQQDWTDNFQKKNASKLADTSASQLSDKFNSAEPFRHLVFDGFLNKRFCEDLRQELITNLDVKPKETDLFKFHQTGDLASLFREAEAAASNAAKVSQKDLQETSADPPRKKAKKGRKKAQAAAVPSRVNTTDEQTTAGAAEQEPDSSRPVPPKHLPNLKALSELLYSQAFRTRLQRMLGLSEEEVLTERVDMSAQAYTQGCHLMCHDDVISTRKITFVLYLDEPDTPWQAEFGGGMEFYTESDPKPCAELFPDFNTFLLFGVEPGKSYHAVREVTSEAKTRLSLQGWYHVADIRHTYSYALRNEKATLQQLVGGADAEKTEAEHAAVVAEVELATTAAKRQKENATTASGFGTRKTSNSMLAEHLKKKKAEEREVAAAQQRIESGDRTSEVDEELLEEEEEEEPSSSSEDSVVDEDDFDDQLIENTRKHLGNFIHPEYLTKRGMFQLRQYFKENSEVMLTSFLKPEISGMFLDLMRKADEVDGVTNFDKAVSYTAGEQDGWSTVGPSFLQRYMQYDHRSAAAMKNPCGDDAGALSNEMTSMKSMKNIKRKKKNAPANSTAAPHDNTPHAALGDQLQTQIISHLFNQPAFHAYLRAIVGLPLRTKVEDNDKLAQQATPKIRRFRPGLDYTIASLQHCIGTHNMLDVCYMLVDDQKNTSFPWDSEEVGGFESYVEADDDETDEKAEVYLDNAEDGPLLNIPASNNALSLVLRDKKTLSFLKFLSKSAPSSRVDVKMSLAVLDDEKEKC
ncbi:unnamed protein product [Amoebophrya sp. A120]|nr:unnamed protein product [Amoebophrya sp. A120]|eukprot:GSA120T00020150001.1